MNILKYSSEKEVEWNQFLTNSKNSTFLFNRQFMGYHKDRFKDHSLMVYDDNGKLLACFPANEDSSNVIYSHQGLTYGGVILTKELKLLPTVDIFNSILQYYSKAGFSKLKYKAFPRFYNDAQTDELEYCLFLNDAKLYRRDTAICIDRQVRIKYAGNIRREAKKAKEKGILINEDSDFKNFWNGVLIPNLNSRFEVNPVHSSVEIDLLKNSFPDNIKLFTARNGSGQILAGTVFFITDNVAHCQYISASDEGRAIGALNLLFVTLIDECFLEKQFFDFGIANEENGRKLNTGLLTWKERMGGRTYSHDFYEIDLGMNSQGTSYEHV